MSPPQEYWDACLIKTWRNAGNLRDIFVLFYSITKTKASELELLRFPRHGLPTEVGVRVFAAQYLPKMSDWLWSKPSERDVELLKKLSTSKYDTLDKPFISDNEKELNIERKRVYRNRLRVGMDRTAYNNRNHDTDWSVTKGARSKTRGRA